jgi:hypothetical protein
MQQTPATRSPPGGIIPMAAVGLPGLCRRSHDAVLTTTNLS